MCEVKCLNGKVPDPGFVSGEMSQNFVQKNIRNYKIVCVENKDGEAVWTRNLKQFHSLAIESCDDLIGRGFLSATAEIFTNF